MAPTTFVVPLDGSLFAERAVPIACALAERVGGRLLLVSAPYKGPLEPRAYLADVAARGTTVPVDTVASDAYLPADALASAVGESDDRIICMTTHGRNGLRWSMLGSTAEEVVRRSDRPVLLVGQRCRDDFLGAGSHLLAAVDGIENSKHLASVATAWAERLDLQLDAALVVHPLDVESAERPDVLLDPLVAEFGGLERAHARLLRGSYVAGTLVDFAGSLPAAIIAMNSHGRTGLARITLGSVTMGVVHLANCPVLVTHNDN